MPDKQKNEFAAMCAAIGLDDTQLAAKVGCDRKTIGRYRRGITKVKQPVFEQVERIYKATRKKKA